MFAIAFDVRSPDNHLSSVPINIPYFIVDCFAIVPILRNKKEERKRDIEINTEREAQRKTHTERKSDREGECVSERVTEREKKRQRQRDRSVCM